MVLDNLGDSLKSALSKLTGASFVDEKLINEIVKEFQRSLLQADVNVQLVFSLTNEIKQRAKQKTPSGLTKREHLVNIVYEELTKFLGGESEGFVVEKKPFVIMLVGLFGNGKTTTAGKLAKYFKNRGKTVSLISTDTWRPAAFEQLKQLGAQVGVSVYGDPSQKDPSQIFSTYKQEALTSDVVIVDTAGRDALSDELVAEISAIDAVVNADEKLLVMAADMGQGAQKQAQMFHDTVGVTGVVLTKLDGTAKGGGALSACAATSAPIRFIGVGEKVDALEEFKPKNFVGRLLGMGDLEALLEKAQLAVSEEEAVDMQKKLLKGDFTLLDMYQQLEAVKKMGPLSKVLEMIPGMSSSALPKGALEQQQQNLERFKHVLNSMTKQELEQPEIVSNSRIQRISSGSGQDEKVIRGLLKQHKQSKKLLKQFKGKGSEKQMQKMMQRMGGAGGMPKF
ncbi:MAG: signal recognition particle protein Srp54 [Candidatus Woesearchaeota archaeon]